ncbi:MAG: thioredoxin [Candidatus Levybacteria bacterium]|nr:thioredoxin [Candidatus Levybacteria bacterium]MBP9815194.1 thioredoxin [Candidatus Levybacteria bacterium]
MADTIFTDDTFEQEVLKSEMPVLVDFWAEWCTPCHMLTPTLAEIEKEYEGKIKIGKMNVDENIKTPGNFSIMSIPTVILFKGGKPVSTTVGVQAKDVYKKSIDEALSS